MTSESYPSLESLRETGRRIVRQFASCPPDRFAPHGYTGTPMAGAFIPYPISVLWANAIRFARLTKDAELTRILAVETLAPYLPPAAGRAATAEHAKCPDPCHVDLSVFGTVPLEAYLATGDGVCLAFGEAYAERQWAAPRENDYAKLPPSMFGGGHTPDFTVRQRNFADGLTGQTRFWTDDMFMIAFLQTRAALAATKNARSAVARERLDRTARQAVRYLDDLQLREGRGKGLFYHAPDAPQCWGRGNGWMAAGLTTLLDALPGDHPSFDRILQGYRTMMAALFKWRRDNGYWGQLVDLKESWDESSATAIFTYCFIRGVLRGWLEPDAYAPAAHRSYAALVASLDADANLPGVCVGTDIGKTAEHYLGRDRVKGAPHGQAGLLLCVNAWLDGHAKPV